MEEDNTVRFYLRGCAWCEKKKLGSVNCSKCCFTCVIYDPYVVPRALYGLSGPEEQLWINQLTCNETSLCNYEITSLSQTRCNTTEQAAGVRCEAGEYCQLNFAFRKSLYVDSIQFQESVPLMGKYVQEIVHIAILMEDLYSLHMWRYVKTLHMGCCVALDGAILKQKYCARGKDIILHITVINFMCVYM